MMLRADNRRRILGLQVGGRAFGFAVIEAPNTLVDWGVRAVRCDKCHTLRTKVDALCAYYQPDVIVVNEPQACSSGTPTQAAGLVGEVKRAISQHGLRFHVLPRGCVAQVFSTFGARTHFEVAGVVAQQLPELAVFMPRRRQLWMTEDHRMPYFRAAALTLAYVHLAPHHLPPR